MPRGPRSAIQIRLTRAQRAQLQWLRDQGKRATLILQVAAGKTITEATTLAGMARSSHVYQWLHRWLEEGMPGLHDRRRDGQAKAAWLRLQNLQKETNDDPRPAAKSARTSLP